MRRARKVLVGMAAVLSMATAAVPVAQAQTASGATWFINAFTSLDSSITVDSASVAFVKTHFKWFPAKRMDHSYQRFINKHLSIPLIMKEPELYDTKLFRGTGEVIEIHQYKNPVYSEVQIVLGDGSNALLLIEAGSGSIIQGSVVRFVGLPVCEWDFSNVSGGTTQSILFDGVSLVKLR